MGASCCAIRAVDREYAASAYGGYTHPTGTATAAEHTGTYTAGTGPSCLCPANCKNGHTSVTDHVGAAAAYHSDRAIGGKYAATAHGRCAHPVRTEAAAERTSVHAAGADPSRLCPASHKGDRVSTTNHAGTAGGAASHSDHANVRKCTASAISSLRGRVSSVSSRRPMAFFPSSGVLPWALSPSASTKRP